LLGQEFIKMLIGVPANKAFREKKMKIFVSLWLRGRRFKLMRFRGQEI